MAGTSSIDRVKDQMSKHMERTGVRFPDMKNTGTGNQSTRKKHSHAGGDPFTDLAKSSQNIQHVEVIEETNPQDEDKYAHKELSSFLRLYNLVQREALPWWHDMPYWMRDAMKNWLPPEAFKDREYARSNEKLTGDELDRQTEGTFSMAWGVFGQICNMIAHSHIFVFFMLFIILLNTIFMGLMVDSDMPASTADAIDNIFIAIFVVESIIRVMAYQAGMHHGGLLFFEVLIVFIAVVDKWIIPFLLATHHDIDLSVLTVFRVGRILQSVRMFHVITFMRPLRIMERAVSRAVLYFFWNFVFLISLSYIFALGFRIFLGRLENPPPNYGMKEDYMGNTLRALIYFVNAVMNGMDWVEMMFDPLVARGQTRAAAYMLFTFIFAFQIAIVIMIKASFIENFFAAGFRESVEVDREILARQLDLDGLTEILEACDEKGDGRITFLELLAPLRSPKSQVRQKFRKVFGLQRFQLENKDLHLQRCERYLQAFFQAMDFGKEGSISIDQILWGYIKLSGKNYVDDIVKDYSLQKLLRILENPDKDFRVVSERLDRVEANIRRNTSRAERLHKTLDDDLKPFDEALERLERRFDDVSVSLLQPEAGKVDEDAALAPGAAGVASLRLRAEMDALKKAAMELLAETEEPPQEPPAASPWWELQGDQLHM